MGRQPGLQFVTRVDNDSDSATGRLEFGFQLRGETASVDFTYDIERWVLRRDRAALVQTQRFSTPSEGAEWWSGRELCFGPLPCRF